MPDICHKKVRSHLQYSVISLSKNSYKDKSDYWVIKQQKNKQRRECLLKVECQVKKQLVELNKGLQINIMLGAVGRKSEKEEIEY